MSLPEIKVFPTPADVARFGAERFVEAAAFTVGQGRNFRVALSGGSTPKAMHELLASDEFKKRVDWNRVEIFFGDERTVGPDDAQSNYRMAREALLSKVPIPGDNVYRMHGEADPHAAAVEYGKMLKEKFGTWEDGVGLDLVYLGMGDDGHTLSLFPHTAALSETHHRCVANHVEKLNTWRITMSAPFVNRAWEVIFLVTGSGKAERVAQVLEGDKNPDELPSQLIAPDLGRLVWAIDTAAAGM